MKLSENKSGDFTPHPESEGTINGVLVDITPLKEVPDKFNPGQTKEVFRLVYETEVNDDANDRRFCIWPRPYTPSLNEKANFRKDIKKILGRDLTKMELDEFDNADPNIVPHGRDEFLVRDEVLTGGACLLVVPDGGEVAGLAQQLLPAHHLTR